MKPTIVPPVDPFGRLDLKVIDRAPRSSAIRPDQPLSFASSGFEHLAQIAVEAELVPGNTAEVIPQVFQAFDAEGLPVNPLAEVNLCIALDDLKWWSDALEAARANGQLAPAAFRIQAAAAADNVSENFTPVPVSGPR